MSTDITYIMSGEEKTDNRISVTRALAELKTLNKRIAKLTNETTFASTHVAGRPWHDHSDSTRANYQALQDLMNRYSAIKYAVIRSNATTTVVISGTEYTVAEAIAKKESIRQQKELLARLKRFRTNVKNEVEQHNYRTQQKLDDLLKTSFGQNRKADETDVKAMTDAYLKNNRIETVDPLGLDQRVTELEEEISEFEKEVDFVLSESNAITKLYL